jgi:hypothetical protein
VHKSYIRSHFTEAFKVSICLEILYFKLCAVGLTPRGVTGISFWGCKFLSGNGETAHIIPIWVMIFQSVKSFIIG